jgi:hypothetical protein
MTRNCPNCDRLLTYKSKAGYERGKRLNSVCNSCSKLDHLPTCFSGYLNLPPLTPLKQVVGNSYTFIGIVSVPVCVRSWLKLQVIEFICPHCQSPVTKKLPLFGITIKTSCNACKKPYQLTTKTVSDALQFGQLYKNKTI